MNWNWEKMTGPEFSAAVKKTGGTCVLTIGSVERHCNHLPLGNDTLTIHRLAELAVAKEPAVLFPHYYFGQELESKNRPGAIVLGSDMIFHLLDNLCDEIARNGCHKIIILNGHGGNEPFLSHFAVTRLEKPRNYQLYLIRLHDYYNPVNDPQWDKMKETKVDWHAGESETSVSLALLPDLVHTDQIPKQPGMPIKKMDALPAFCTGTWWTGHFPDQYAGDARCATKAKGQYLVKYQVGRITAIIKAVKQDRTVAQAEADYHRDAEAFRKVFKK